MNMYKLFNQLIEIEKKKLFTKIKKLLHIIFIKKIKLTIFRGKVLEKYVIKHNIIILIIKIVIKFIIKKYRSGIVEKIYNNLTFEVY